MPEFRERRDRIKREERLTIQDGWAPKVDIQIREAGNTKFTFPSPEAIELEGLKLSNAVDPKKDDDARIRLGLIETSDNLVKAIKRTRSFLETAAQHSEAGEHSVSETDIDTARASFENAKSIAKTMVERYADVIPKEQIASPSAR